MPRSARWSQVSFKKKKRSGYQAKWSVRTLSLESWVMSPTDLNECGSVRNTVKCARKCGETCVSLPSNSASTAAAASSVPRNRVTGRRRQRSASFHESSFSLEEQSSTALRDHLLRIISRPDFSTVSSTTSWLHPTCRPRRRNNEFATTPAKWLRTYLSQSLCPSRMIVYVHHDGHLILVAAVGSRLRQLRWLVVWAVKMKLLQPLLGCH